jgi:two-component system chemotaxis sensor kinase CheA
MDDLLREFLTETGENIAVLDVELVKLEQNPNDPNLLSSIFRLVHTVKGTCGFLGLPRLEAVAHASENVLGKFRDGELEVTVPAVTLILESLDCIKRILSVLEQTEAEPVGNDSDLIERLNVLAQGGAPAAKPSAELVSAPKSAAEVKVEPVPAPEPAAEVQTEPAPGPTPTAAAAEPVETESALVPASDKKPAAASAKAAEPVEKGEIKESAVAAQSIRVTVDVLENLMTMVSELVLTRNQLMQIVRRFKDSEFTVPLQRLSQVTSELQEGVMKTRMQPIGNAWAKLPRLVRDLSHELNKKIDLQMLGAETELDRQVLELIKDPLTHMVRNSADHGIETPDIRTAAGKPELGRIMLNAYHEGGHIIIEITDDGKGLDITKIKQKIVQNGLASEAELDGMSDQQIHQFIFKAGFSTAEKVTAVSGRGVGMDVVRTNIEKIGGTIELKSQLGRGSSFIIKIPLTLAIVSALIVECCAERFAIPQLSVVELVRAATDSEHKIEMINGTPVLRLRNRLLPLVSLESLLNLEREGKTPAETFIVVTQIGTYTFGIMVDRVFDTEEIVVKPVAPILRHITMFSGNTILGDGSVIMILDPNGIASATGGVSMSETHSAETATARESTSQDRVALLLFGAGDGTPRAVPLGLVARLEEIGSSTIEYADGKPLVQYRGKLMPLVPVHPGYEMRKDGRQPVLVFADGERSMGLLVDEIIDIVDDRIVIELKVDRPGSMGSAIIAGKATDMIDAGFYLTQAYGDWFGGTANKLGSAKASPKRLLVVDDNAFFRNLITPVLGVAGYEVTAVESAERALQLFESGREFDAIVSDIEMPGMGGLVFAETVRKSGRWQSVPMIALSSRTGPEDLERGRAAGFTDYVAKSDRDTLISVLEETLAAPVPAIAA